MRLPKVILQTQMKAQWIWDIARIPSLGLGPSGLAPWSQEAQRELQKVCGKSSFHRAFLILPEPKRSFFWLLYAWMKLADEQADHRDSNLNRLNRFRSLTRQALDGRYFLSEQNPEDPPHWGLVFSKLKVFAHLPKMPFEDMLDGQCSDLDFQQPQSQDGLIRYCDQVASSVGTLILELLEDPSPELARSLGRSLQLLNIARDLKEDFDQGRLYLPIDWVGVRQPQWSLQVPGLEKGLERTQDLLASELRRSRELEHRLKKPLSRLFVGLIRKAYDPWWRRLEANPFAFLGPQKPLSVSERLRSLL